MWMQMLCGIQNISLNSRNAILSARIANAPMFGWKMCRNSQADQWATSFHAAMQTRNQMLT